MTSPVVGVSTGAIPVNSTTGMATGGFVEITDGSDAIVGTITSFVANVSVTVTPAAILSGSSSPGASVYSVTKLDSSPISVNSSGQATVTGVSYATVAQLGVHTVWATSYSPPTATPINYAASAGDMNETVLDAANFSPAIVAVSNTWGQSLVYTIKLTSPQGGTPTGTVSALETVSRTGQTTSSSSAVTVSSTTFLTTGMSVTGAGIPAVTATIVSVNSATSITLNQAATATATDAALTFTIARGNVGTLILGPSHDHHPRRHARRRLAQPDVHLQRRLELRPYFLDDQPARLRRHHDAHACRRPLHQRRTRRISHVHRHLEGQRHQPRRHPRLARQRHQPNSIKDGSTTLTTATLTWSNTGSRTKKAGH